MPPALALPRNDVRQYEGMADQWWLPNPTGRYSTRSAAKRT